MAGACHGVVYTGEAGMEGPRGHYHPHPKVDEGVVDVLTLEWVVSASKPSVRSAQTFLDVLGASLPEARPVRFGFGEPYQGQLGPDDDGPFLEGWKECRTDTLPWSLPGISFKSRPPCFWGSVWFPMKHRRADETFEAYKAREPTPTENIVNITLFLDAGAVTKDGHLCRRVVEMFVLMARGLESLYARGYVERGFTKYRGSYLDTGETVYQPTPLGMGWVGIPPGLAWLNWFGAPYKPLLLDALKRAEPVVFEDGAFVRFGTEPADIRQLQAVKLDLPAELLIRQAVDNTARGQVMAALRQLDPNETGKEKLPVYARREAEFVPKLG